MKRKVRWGILSTAAIGIDKVIPAMQQGDWSEVSAIASRDIDKAMQVAERLSASAPARVRNDDRQSVARIATSWSELFETHRL